MHEPPLASDLAPARGPTHPDTDLLPSGQGCARPVEAVGEGHILAHRNGQVGNFIADRTRERRERLFPTFPHCICSHVLERGHDVERHDLRRVHGHYPIEVLRAKRLDKPLYQPFDFNFIVFLALFACHSFLLTLACYEPHVLVVIRPPIPWRYRVEPTRR